jgi:alpha-glucosidase (family GH31 glycosyl hydrolase)
MPLSRSISRRGLLKHLGAGSAILPQLKAQAAELQIAGRAAEIQITPVSAQTVRIAVLAVESGKAVPLADDGALIQIPAAGMQSFRDGSTRSVRAGDLRVQFASEPLTFTVQDGKGETVQQIGIDKATGNVSFDIGSAPLLGLGEGGPQFDRRGANDSMRSGQGGYRLATHGGRVPVQLVIGTSGWALFIHQPLGPFDLTGKRGLVRPASPEAALPIDLFLIASKTPAVIMAEYAKLSGLPELPPLWAFGYQQSHRTLGPPEEIMQEARLFREKKLPCDAMIYLGTDFCPNGWNTHNGEFNWNPKPFPDPKRAIDELHAQNFKVVLHTVLEGRKLTGTVHDPCTAAALPSGRTTDSHWPPDRQVSCYWPVHKQLLDIGIDGWWPDQGDGLDAPSRLARNRMYFEGHQMYRPNERVYALHRNGYAGMQRYAAFLWSGDVQSTWETLKTHISVAVNTGLSGIPYWGTDIAGFVPSKDLTGEFYVRWFQFAAFSPLFRAHGRTWKLRLPWGWNTGDPGPIETPNVIPPDSELHNAAIEPICRKYLDLRYRMMPYLYSVVRESTKTGMPILRALWLHYPDDATAVARGDQYLWGRDVLVAPVVEKSATSRQVYLPPGAWYDFWTNERMEGGRGIERKVDLETMPLYVRAGALLPMGPVKQYTGEKVEGPLTVQIYQGADGRFLLYEDDGKSFNFRRGEWMGIELAWSGARKTLSMRLASGSRMLAPAKRNIEVKLGGETKAVVFEGRPVAVRF